MLVRSVHERLLLASPDAVGELLDALGGAHDRLWPAGRWPPLRLDRPLRVEAAGGHGPIGYAVVAHEPGRRVVFRFTEPRGLVGVHRFEVEPRQGVGVVLRHTLEASLRGRLLLGWLLVLRPLHDALLEDLLDRAELAVEGRVHAPAGWTAYVRLLRPLRRARRRAAAGGGWHDAPVDGGHR
ncbi:SRPBCC family protein [Motilibacter aurantiacus]|uniref:SRPBCC family protein n=1 Tax=Motilibacter aurantiacus TaxID=2714955 RepID=UPI00140A87A1|nr:SRPBCC family protein [Motilibacter aurantiacus]NHC44962.1 SRPBCC family protein [Motilibacter aurantiacus]